MEKVIFETDTEKLTVRTSTDNKIVVRHEYIDEWLSEITLYKDELDKIVDFANSIKE